MKQCQKCKTYKDCLGKEWYHYGEIRWCPYQVIWIILNSEEILDGDWPPNPERSSYTDPNIKTGYRNEAYYTKPELILGELEWRLNKTGADGRALGLAIEARKSQKEFNDECQCALYYITGKSLLLNPDGSWKRKKMEYIDWRKQWRFRHGMTTKSPR